MAKPVKKWMGSTPDTCNICGVKLEYAFVDGRVAQVDLDGCITAYGWAMVCPECHERHGLGLGTGKGQMYGKVENDWIKLEG
jgi:hypothetical protein